ncbi:MAG: ABC transporter permease [Steroidobacteraceae bacterium]
MTEATARDLLPPPMHGWRALHVVRRNALVWRKLMITSLVGNLAEPLIYLVGLGYGVGALIGEIDGRPYVTFLAAGMICYSTMNSASFEALYSAFARMQVQRTWEGMLHAPLTSDDIVTGEWLWAGMKALFSGIAILLVMYALGIVRGFGPIAVLPVALLIGLAFAGIALVVTSFAKSYDFFTHYFVLLVTPMSFLSGIYFPLSQLPDAAQTAAWLLPLAHGASLARGLTLGDPMPWPALSVGVLLAYGLVGLAIAKHRVRQRLSR